MEPLSWERVGKKLLSIYTTPFFSYSCILLSDTYLVHNTNLEYNIFNLTNVIRVIRQNANSLPYSLQYSGVCVKTVLSGIDSPDWADTGNVDRKADPACHQTNYINMGLTIYLLHINNNKQVLKGMAQMRDGRNSSLSVFNFCSPQAQETNGQHCECQSGKFFVRKTKNHQKKIYFTDGKSQFCTLVFICHI